MTTICFTELAAAITIQPVAKELPTIWRRCGGAALMATNLLLVLCSCRKISERSALPTFPVTGKVVTNGDQVPVGGCVQFEPDGNGVEYTAIGLIEADGSFSLSTPYVDRVLPGATDGSHSVSVLLPLEGAGGGGIVRINDRFIVRPRENNFIINLPKAH